MWLLIEPVLEQLAYDEIVRILEAMGILTKTEGAVINSAEALKLAVDNLKFTRSYPGDLNGPTNVSNIVVTQP